jgi:esterase/lipase superfamily enzyme
MQAPSQIDAEPSAEAMDAEDMEAKAEEAEEEESEDEEEEPGTSKTMDIAGELARLGDLAGAAAAASAADTAYAQGDGCALVKVYYATDRARVDTAAARATAWVMWLIATLGCAVVAVVSSSVVPRLSNRYRWLRRLPSLVACCAVMLGLWTGYVVWRDKLAGEPADAEALVSYGNERGPLELGTCMVAIPKSHALGKMERPSVLKLDFRENPAKHVVLLGVSPQESDDFFQELKAGVDESPRKRAFVFIHGYNVKFADAARRAAQIAYDLRYDGVPILYTWPSQGTLSGYTIDETNVEWTVTHLKHFLGQIAKRSGASQVHLVAHSMGNRALAAALREISHQPDGQRPIFSEVVLTAPDIDADTFKRELAPAIVKTAQRVTLYASSNDEALRLSQSVHGYPRAGDTDDDLVVVPGVDTIDVSEVDTSLVGHSYYGANSSVLADLFDLLHQSKPPEERQWLREEYLGDSRYWVFQR